MDIMGIVILAIGVPISLYFLYRTIKAGREDVWVRKSESQIMAEILAKSIIEVRKRLFEGENKYLEECGFSPSECAEYHLPGDCPLCGAQ